MEDALDIHDRATTVFSLSFTPLLLAFSLLYISFSLTAGKLARPFSMPLSRKLDDDDDLNPRFYPRLMKFGERPTESTKRRAPNELLTLPVGC